MFSVSECKEKWRNLRTVFVRKMKPPGNKRPYYLAEAMQFCLPYVKVSGPHTSGVLPPAPPEETTENTLAIEAEYDSSFVDDPVDIKQEPPTPPSPSPPECLERSIPLKHKISRPVQSLLTKRTVSLRQKLAAEADKCVIEYFKAKKTKLEAAVNDSVAISTKTDKKEALKMFLLSLTPELEEFNDSQIKTFKRRVFNLIDDIST